MWESILKKRTKIRIWHRYVDEIMSDGQALSSRDLYNKLIDYMRSPDVRGQPRTGRNIPHISHVTTYLSGSPKFTKVQSDWKGVVWEWVGEEQ